MEKVHYKVVCKKVIKRKKRLFSYFAKFEGTEIEYKLNKWVKAPLEKALKGYHLLVFDNLDNAVEFIKDCNFKNIFIYKCHIKNKIQSIPDKFEINSGLKWPKGTIMAKQVKIFGNKINFMRSYREIQRHYYQKLINDYGKYIL